MALSTVTLHAVVPVNGIGDIDGAVGGVTAIDVAAAGSESIATVLTTV